MAQVVAMNSELEETRSELKKSCESLEACQRKLLQMESLRAEHQEIIRTLQEDKELTQAKYARTTQAPLIPWGFA